MKDAPCRFCEERYPGCHGSCPRYREWREPFDNAIAERNKARIADSTLIESTIKKGIRWKNTFK